MNMKPETKAKLLMKITGLFSNRVVSFILFVTMAYFVVYWVIMAIYHPMKYLIISTQSIWVFIIQMISKW